MEFFTIGDVLAHPDTNASTDPAVIHKDELIKDAVTMMFDNGYSQLPVQSDERICGAISYRSIAKYLKALGSVNILERNVGLAIEHPEFVDAGQDIYQLFEVLATDDYVLVGEPDRLEGLMTSTDVYFFLKAQVRHFLLIGDIEHALRTTFSEAFEDVEAAIAETFQEREHADESYSAPEHLWDFGFWEYERFIATHWETLDAYFTTDCDVVLKMIQEVGTIRNALFHFREDADRVDRDVIEITYEQVIEARNQAISTS